MNVTRFYVLSGVVFLAALLYVIFQLPAPATFISDPDWGHQLAGAQQILNGEHPFIDYHITYGPLTFYASALAQIVSNGRPIGEIALIVFGYAAGYTLLFVSMWQISKREWVAALFFLLALISLPRLYKYYIVLWPAFSLLTIWWYIDKPAPRSIALMGLATAITGLFRHDFGVFVAIPAFLSIVFHSGLPFQLRLRHLAYFTAATVISASPWLIWALLKGGLGRYFYESIFSSINHAAGLDLPFPVFQLTPLISRENGVFFAYVIFYSLPFISLAALRRNLTGVYSLKVLVTVVMAQMTLMQSWHRSEFNHLLQSIPISFVLGAWLTSWGIVHIRDQKLWLRPLAAATLAVLAFTGLVLLYLNMPVLKEPSTVVESLRIYTQTPAEVVHHINQNDPNHPYTESMLFIRNCTTEEDRILSLPLLTNYYYFVGRRFGGGQMLVVPGYFTSPEEQRDMIERMKAENVTLVLYQLDFKLDNREERQMSVFAPLVNHYIEENYTEIKRYGTLSLRGVKNCPQK